MSRFLRTGTAVLVCTIAAAIAVPLATSVGTGIAAAAVSCDRVGAWDAAAVCGAGGPPTDSPTSTPPPLVDGLHYFSAPYVMPGERLPDLNAVMATTGQKTFMLAFILAPTGGGCTPTWDGTRPLSSDTLAHVSVSTRS